MNTFIKRFSEELPEIPFYEKGGRKYSAVKDRLDLFRGGWPDYSISTRIVSYGAEIGDKVLVKATIKNGFGRTIATGYSEQVRGDGEFNLHSPVEVAETKAIGRALACFGIAGGEYASADEISSVLSMGHSRSNSGGISLDDEGDTLSIPGTILRSQEQVDVNAAPHNITIIKDDKHRIGDDELVIPWQHKAAGTDEANPGGELVEGGPYDLITRTMMEMLKVQRDIDDLLHYHSNNRPLIDEIKSKAPELHKKLMASFTERKNQLTKGI